MKVFNAMNSSPRQTRLNTVGYCSRSMNRTNTSRDKSSQTPRHLLIFSTGSLGDTLLVVPSVRVLREHFSHAELVMLGDVQAGSGYVLAKEVLAGSGLIDRTLSYTVHHGTLYRLKNFASRLSLLSVLRRKGFDTLAYFPEVYRQDPRIARYRWFFRMAGIRHFIGMEGLEERPTSRGLAIATVRNRADELLGRIAAAGIPVPPPGCGNIDLNLQPTEFEAFEQWRSTQAPDGGRLWVGIGPGSKMPAKVWPVERFEALIRHLIETFDVWPVVFGGPEDASLGNQLVRAWGRGFVAAGALGVRVSAIGLQHCRLYVGNDTGTMHLAAAAGTLCVGIFSSREPPGRWNPYGAGHRTLRSDIDCAGCQLIECIERRNECLLRIPVEAVYGACREILVECRPLSAGAS